MCICYARSSLFARHQITIYSGEQTWLGNPTSSGFFKEHRVPGAHLDSRIQIRQQEFPRHILISPLVELPKVLWLPSSSIFLGNLMSHNANGFSQVVSLSRSYI